MLATSSALLYCTALQTQPLSVLKESACDVACQLKCLSVIHSRKKKPIASSDAWQYCLKGCRRMPDSTSQLTVNLSIISCTCHNSLSAIIPV